MYVQKPHYSGPFQYYDPGQNMMTGMLMATPILQGVTVVAVPSGPAPPLPPKLYNEAGKLTPQPAAYVAGQPGHLMGPGNRVQPPPYQPAPPFHPPNGGESPTTHCNPVQPCFNSPPPAKPDSACLMVGGGGLHGGPRMQIPVKNNGDGCPLHRPHSGTPHMMYWDASNPTGSLRYICKCT